MPPNMLEPRHQPDQYDAQPVSQSVGVGTGALILYMLLRSHGGAAPSAADFSLAFAVVGGLSMLSVPFFMRMSPDAGADVSGHVAAKPSGP